MYITHQIIKFNKLEKLISLFKYMFNILCWNIFPCPRYYPQFRIICSNWCYILNVVIRVFGFTKNNDLFFHNNENCLTNIYNLILSPYAFPKNIGWNYCFQWAEKILILLPFSFPNRKKDKIINNNQILILDGERGVAPKEIFTLNLIQCICLFSKEKKTYEWLHEVRLFILNGIKGITRQNSNKYSILHVYIYVNNHK